MPTAPEHVFKEKSTKILILLPVRTIYFQTFQCETPCTIASTLISWTEIVGRIIPRTIYVPLSVDDKINKPDLLDFLSKSLRIFFIRTTAT